ncbi:MAG: bifunctional glutamate N-acetyltransferase/amino-acid acetyltransferase ArgJ [Deltaproteobacteria bacterium]|nr:bifunctional glutamate N-acetyltransferase/amino-acid acetyltransferase ArgJ [Deltaproteobacteria bacterium]
MAGFKAAGISCGIKKTGRKDLAIILSDSPASVAGVFTTNRVKAAPVLIDMELVRSGKSSGVLVNSGNANACTGRKGYKDALQSVRATEDCLGLPKGCLLVASTGVIGVPMPIEKVCAGLPRLVEGLRPGGLHDASEAIMTTDAFAKRAFGRAKIAGKTITIAGIAKGAGMICPNMATMLAFFMTDANIKPVTLKKALLSAVDSSFNSIIVDNDTSTNDTALIFANGAAKGAEIKAASRDFKAFAALLTEVSLELSHKIVKDGEGATRFIEIDVRGASTPVEARQAARTIASSFLVKTAFFGGDPNWGRIMAALGYSGVRMDEKSVSIFFNNVCVARRGLDTGAEVLAAKAIKSKTVNVRVELKAGGHDAKVWTTDLSYDYVKINSAYRT